MNALAVQALDLHAAWQPENYSHLDTAYPKAYFLEDVEAKNLYVVRKGGQTAAYIRVRVSQRMAGETPIRALYLEELCVDKAFRRRGIGRQILADVKALARELGCARVLLSVVPRNRDAIAFYESAGFSVRMIDYQAEI